EAAVRRVFRQLLCQRTPDPDGKPGPDDRPFRGLAAGPTPAGDAQYPGGLGLDDTLFAADRAAGADDPGKRLFQLGDPPGHPYRRDQLLTKIYNQVTTRSHVFAVWLTVGFFEVTDAAARPVKLGAEVGRAENRHVRHRLFAVVDRSVLVRNPGPQPRFDPRGASPRTGPAAPPEARRVGPYCRVP